MKLIQLNIWGGKLQYQIPAFLNKEQPDIVCMQEVNDLPGPSGALFVTLDELKEAGNFQHCFMSPTYSSKYMNRTTRYGNAILSRLPFLKTETVFTYGQYKDSFDLTTDDFNVRNFQHAQIEYRGQIINVLNHHGYLVRESKLGNHETAHQMQLIAAALNSLTGPIILAGDFNLSPHSESIGLLNKQLRNLSAEYNLNSTYTSFNKHIEVCDYIFVSDSIKVKAFHASDEVVSDHKALVLEFDI